MSENMAQQDGAAPAGESAEIAQVAPPRNFWQQPFVQNVLPFATSLLLHVGIIVLGYATYQAVKAVSTVIKEQIIIPSADIVEGAEIGGVPNPGLGTDPNVQANVTIDIQEQTQKLAERSSISVGAVGGEGESDGVIGVGSGSARMGMGSGGFGKSDGGGTPFGVPGGASGPRSPFMGVSSNAFRVAYICDASGTMLTAKYKLLSELKAAVDRLKPVQFYNIFFFRGTGFEAFNDRQLVPATPQNKISAIKAETGWIDSNYNTELGGTPIPALRAAMAQDPQLIYLLTDGLEDQSNPELPNQVRKEIQKLNSAKKVKINTILLEREEVAKARRVPEAQRKWDEKNIVSEANRLAEILQSIATDNGGVFRAVPFDDIN